MKCILFMPLIQVHFHFVKAENSKSFDIGIEKSYLNNSLKFDLTYFNLKYDNLLEGWKDNNSSGAAYTTQNSEGIVKSQGLEFTSSWPVLRT